MIPLGFRLEEFGDRLQLVRENDETHPVWIDFTQNGQSPQQLRRKLARSNPMFRALGSPKDIKIVWDLTAGFGQDAFYMALMGYQVCAFEQSPVLFALLQNAIERLNKIEAFHDVLSRLEFRHEDSRTVLEHVVRLPDAIYLDPMYPEKKKTALPRKEMRWLRDLVGEDQTGTDLLDMAISMKVPRIVVKRPLKGEVLREQPVHSFQGQSTRYDLYLGKA